MRLLKLWTILISLVTFTTANEIDRDINYDSISEQCMATLKSRSILNFKIENDEYEITPFGFCQGYACHNMRGTLNSIFILSKNNRMYSYIKEIPIRLYEKMKLELGGDDEILRRLTQNEKTRRIENPKKYITETYLPSEVYEDSDVVYSLLRDLNIDESSFSNDSVQYYHYPVFEKCMISKISPIIKLRREGKAISIDGLRSGQCELCGAAAVFKLDNGNSNCYKPNVKIRDVDEYITNNRPYREVGNKKVAFKQKIEKLYENICSVNK